MNPAPKRDMAARGNWLSVGLTKKWTTRLRRLRRSQSSLTIRIAATYTLTAAMTRTGLIRTTGRPGNAAVPLIPSQFRLLAIHGMLARLGRSEEHTSELQSPCNLVCRLLLEKKKKDIYILPNDRRRLSIRHDLVDLLV